VSKTPPSPPPPPPPPLLLLLLRLTQLLYHARSHRSRPADANKRRFAKTFNDKDEIAVSIKTRRCSTDGERPHRCCHLPNKVDRTDCSSFLDRLLLKDIYQLFISCYGCVL